MFKIILISILIFISHDKEENINTENEKVIEKKNTEKNPKTPIQNFIKQFLFNMGYNYANIYTFKIANHDGHLNIIANNSKMDSNSFWAFAEGSCPIYFLPRKEEKNLKKLEKALQDKFNIKKITFSYNSYLENSPDLQIIKVFENHQYIYEDIILGMSQNGKFTEFSFNFGGTIDDFGDIYDMNSGEIISLKDNNFYCTSNHRNCGRGPTDEKKQACETEVKKLRKKYNIKKEINPGLSFFNDIITLNNKFIIYSKKVDYPKKSLEKNLILDIANIININYKHLPTNKEITILTIDNPKCILKPFGFYGHKNMQGLIFLYVDSGCHWTNANIRILSQTLLNTKLSRLHNNIAMHYYNQKNHQTAIAHFQKAISIDPKYAQAHYNFACTTSLSKQPQKALTHLQKAIELEPQKFIEKAKKDPDFDNIRHEAEFQKILL